jgi:hypothetical protein
MKNGATTKSWLVNVSPHHLDMHGIDKYPPFQMEESQELLDF